MNYITRSTCTECGQPIPHHRKGTWYCRDVCETKGERVIIELRELGGPTKDPVCG